MSKSTQLRIDLDIELQDVGVKTANIGLPEFVAMERHFGIPASQMGGDDVKLEPMFYMAHHALKRQKVPGVPSSFDDFLAVVVDIVNEDEPADVDAGVEDERVKALDKA